MKKGENICRQLAQKEFKNWHVCELCKKLRLDHFFE